MQLFDNSVNVARLLTKKGHIGEDGLPTLSAFELRRDNVTKLPKESSLSLFQDYDNEDCYKLIGTLFSRLKVAYYCIMNVGDIRSFSEDDILYDVIDDSHTHHKFHASIKVTDCKSVSNTILGEPVNYEDIRVLKNLVSCVAKDNVVDILDKIK